jgi:hypothetical protein
MKAKDFINQFQKGSDWLLVKKSEAEAKLKEFTTFHIQKAIEETKQGKDYKPEL